MWQLKVSNIEVHIKKKKFDYYLGQNPTHTQPQGLRKVSMVKKIEHLVVCGKLFPNLYATFPPWQEYLSHSPEKNTDRLPAGS